MLSDHERRTLRRIEADLVANDPSFAESFEASDRASTPAGLLRSHLFWAIAASAGLILVSLAADLPGVVFLGAALVLGSLVWHLNNGGGLTRPNP